MKLSLFVLALTLTLAALTAHPAPADKPQIMVVGTYHFVSKANLYNLSVDDPMSPARQNQIAQLVERLIRFRPTQVVLEQTVGTDDLEQHYQDYIHGKFSLPPSENYQVGFRVAKALRLPAIYTINAFLNLDYAAVENFANSHGQSALLDKATAAAASLNAQLANIQKHGTVLDLYRYLNSPSAIDLNESTYIYLARIGDDENFIGATVVSQWYLRNFEMFAKLTRLAISPNDRILVLYGQGHEFLLQQFIRQSPDLTLVDPAPLLR